MREVFQSISLVIMFILAGWSVFTALLFKYGWLRENRFISTSLNDALLLGCAAGLIGVAVVIGAESLLGLLLTLAGLIVGIVAKVKETLARSSSQEGA